MLFLHKRLFSVLIHL